MLQNFEQSGHGYNILLVASICIHREQSLNAIKSAEDSKLDKLPREWDLGGAWIRVGSSATISYADVYARITYSGT